MDITQSGIYNTSQFWNFSTLNIADNIWVILIDDSTQSFECHIWKKSKLTCFGLSDGGNSKQEKVFFQAQEYSTLELHYILAVQNSSLDLKVESLLQASHTNSLVDILCFAGEKSDIKIDGIIRVEKKTWSCSAELHEKNIFLGSEGKVKWIPSLFIESDDVSAAHSCKMERISDEELFYLRSRGIEKSNALDLLIEGYISKSYKKLQENDWEIFETLRSRILSLL